MQSRGLKLSAVLRYEGGVVKMAKTGLQCLSAKLSLGLSRVSKAQIYSGVAQDLLGVCAGDGGVEKTNARSERRIQSRGRKRNGLRVPGQYSTHSASSALS